MGGGTGGGAIGSCTPCDTCSATELLDCCKTSSRPCVGDVGLTDASGVAAGCGIASTLGAGAVLSVGGSAGSSVSGTVAVKSMCWAPSDCTGSGR